MAQADLIANMQFDAGRGGSTTACSITYPVQTCHGECVPGYAMMLYTTCYFIGEVNTQCSDTADAESVLTRGECWVAAASLVGEGAGRSDQDGATVPHGCYLLNRNDERTVKFNTNSGGSYSGHAEANPVCKKICQHDSDKSRVRSADKIIIESTMCEAEGQSLTWVRVVNHVHRRERYRSRTGPRISMSLRGQLVGL